MKMQEYVLLVKVWVLVIFLSTAVCGLVYIVGQHILRADADDPQIQIAEDLSRALSKDTNPTTLFSSESTDLAKSIAPFVIVYDSAGKPISASAKLNGQMPTPPSEVFDAVKQKGSDRLTWEMEKGLHIATVVMPYTSKDSGYVLAGRSLRDVQSRTQDVLMLTAIVWLGSVVGSAVLLFFLFRKKEKRNRPLLKLTASSPPLSSEE